MFASGSEAHASHLWILSNPALILMQVPTTAARRRRGARAPPFLSVCIHPPHFVLSTAHQPAASSARSLLPAAAAELNGWPLVSRGLGIGVAVARRKAGRPPEPGRTGVDLGTVSLNAGRRPRSWGARIGSRGYVASGHEPRRIGAADFVFLNRCPYELHLDSLFVTSIISWIKYQQSCAGYIILRCSKRSL